MKKLVVLLIGLACITMSGMAQGNSGNTSPAWQFDRLYGKMFPAIELELPDSSIINTSSLAGKTVYVDFWFTSCAPCLKEIPYAKKLQQYFAGDTNIVFLNICIDNIDKKEAWRQLVQRNQMQGIQVFYARNRPQQVNLPRSLSVDTYPAYLLVHRNRVIGYNAPAPSHKGFVQWAIYQASRGIRLSEAYNSIHKRSKESTSYLKANWLAIEADALKP